MPTKPSDPIDRARGIQIERLRGVARIDAITEEMWGRPERRERIVFGKPIARLNHNAKLAKLLGVSERHLRRLRATGEVPDAMLARLTTEWKLWRRRQGEERITTRRQHRRTEREAKIKALRGET